MKMCYEDEKIYVKPDISESRLEDESVSDKISDSFNENSEIASNSQKEIEIETDSQIPKAMSPENSILKDTEVQPREPAIIRPTRIKRKPVRFKDYV